MRQRIARYLSVGAVPFLCVGPVFSASDALAAPNPPGGSAPVNAEKLADQAYKLFVKEQYPEAIAAYMKVYELSGSATALFNVASIYDRKLNEADLAADYYRRFLRAPDADPEQARAANDRLEVFRQRAELAQRGAPLAPQRSHDPPPPLAEASAPAPSAGGGMRVAAVVVGVVGVAGLATAGIASIVAKSKNDEADRYCVGQNCTDPRGVSAADAAGTAAGAATVAFIGGAALATLGAVLYLVTPKASNSGPTTVAVGCAPSATGLSMGLSGRF